MLASESLHERGSHRPVLGPVPTSWAREHRGPESQARQDRMQWGVGWGGWRREGEDELSKRKVHCYQKKGGIDTGWVTVTGFRYSDIINEKEVIWTVTVSIFKVIMSKAAAFSA